VSYADELLSSATKTLTFQRKLQGCKVRGDTQAEAAGLPAKPSYILCQAKLVDSRGSEHTIRKGSNYHKGLYSTLFLVPRKGIVINLKRGDTPALQNGRHGELLRVDDWMTKVGLQYTETTQLYHEVYDRA